MEAMRRNQASVFVHGTLATPGDHIRIIISSQAQGVEARAGRDEEELAVGAAQGELQWAFRHFNGFDQLAGLAVNVDLASCDKDITTPILGHAFTTLVGEGTKVLQAAVRCDGRGPGG